MEFVFSWVTCLVEKIFRNLQGIQHLHNEQFKMSRWQQKIIIHINKQENVTHTFKKGNVIETDPKIIQVLETETRILDQLL